MTKKESEILFQLLGKFESFAENANERHKYSSLQLKEHREEIKNQINLLHDKINDGQANDKVSFEEIKEEIYNDTTGIRVRLISLENTRSNAAKIAAWFGSSGILATIGLYFKDKILSLLHI